MAEKMLWSKNRTRSVNASFVRNFSKQRSREQDMYSVRGWFVPSAWYGSDYFDFGDFVSVEDAQQFLEMLQVQIEG